MPAFSPKPTVGGHDYFEVISALQKHCRRGQVDAALYWATELAISGYHEACWKRLLTITVEDVGQGNPNLICEIRALYDTFRQLSSKGSPWNLAIIEAVLRICRSPKTREADNAYGVFIDNRHFLEPRVVEEWTKGMFTRYGKRLGRDSYYFYEVEAVLDPKADIPDEYEQQAQSLFLNPPRKPSKREAPAVETQAALDL